MYPDMVMGYGGVPRFPETENQVARQRSLQVWVGGR